MGVIFWLTQDLLTVLMSGTVRIPEIFLLSLVYRLFIDNKGNKGDKSDKSEVNVSVIWSAFLGGLLWDLRWIGIPFFTLCYVMVVLGIMSTWNNLSMPGRTLFVIFFLFWVAQLLPGILFVLILERGTDGTAWTLFGVQQSYAVLVALLSTFFYFQQSAK